jgi:small-conductance mechanosensitive channel
MKTEMNRREFLGSFFPVAAHIRTLGGYRHLALRAAKWAVLATCLWFAWQILSGVPLDGWRALGWMALKFVLPAVVLVAAVSWVQRRIEESGNVVLQNVARGIGRVVMLLAAVAGGAVFYHIWQRRPEEAVIALVAVALSQFAAAFSEKPAEKSEAPVR